MLQQCMILTRLTGDVWEGGDNTFLETHTHTNRKTQEGIEQFRSTSTSKLIHDNGPLLSENNLFGHPTTVCQKEHHIHGNDGFQ